MHGTLGVGEPAKMMDSPVYPTPPNARLLSAQLHVAVSASVARGVLTMEAGLKVQLTVIPRRHDESGNLIVELSSPSGAVSGLTKSIDLYVEGVLILATLIETHIAYTQRVAAECAVSLAGRTA